MNGALRLQLPLALTCLLAPAALAQAPDSSPPAARVVLARQVLDAGGTVETMLAAMRANLPAQQQANPQIPAEFWTRFEARITQDAPQLVDSIALIYARRFTQGELQALLNFYRSPVGQRLRVLQPTLVAEGAAVGQRWGMRIGAEIGSSLQKPQ
jgi:uncharacterized protein